MALFLVYFNNHMDMLNLKNCILPCFDISLFCHQMNYVLTLFGAKFTPLSNYFNQTGFFDPEFIASYLTSLPISLSMREINCDSLWTYRIRHINCPWALPLSEGEITSDLDKNCTKMAYFSRFSSNFDHLKTKMIRTMCRLQQGGAYQSRGG